MNNSIKRICVNCQNCYYDSSTGLTECGRYDDMTEEEIETYYVNDRENCPYWE
jgi:hypothetical protein